MVFKATILHCKTILGRGLPGLMRNFGMNHVNGEGSITGSVELQSPVLPVARESNLEFIRMKVIIR